MGKKSFTIELDEEFRKELEEAQKKRRCTTLAAYIRIVLDEAVKKSKEETNAT